MKIKVSVIICIAMLLLVGHTSCSNHRGQPTSASDELLYKQQFDSLRQLVFRGDNEAALQLASCYLEGKVVERSYINAAYIHLYYTGFSDTDFVSIIESYPPNSPYRILVEFIGSGLDYYTLDEEKFGIIKQSLPLEAEAIETFNDFWLDESDTEQCLKSLERLERKGSEVSVLYQFNLYIAESYKGVNEDVYMDFLVKHSDRFPIYFGFLGNLYFGKYIAYQNPSYLQQAITFYCRVKSYGMLESREAHYLSMLYEHCEEEGILPDLNEDSMPY